MAKIKLKKKQKKVIELFSISFLILISILFWNSDFIFPIKLLAVLFHESSHALATVITGGKIENMIVYINLSGSCNSTGGWIPLVASAGYLGSLIFGFLFVKYSNSSTQLKLFSQIISIMLIFIAFSIMGNLFGKLITLLYAVIIFSIPRIIDKFISGIIFKSIGFISCLYVLEDIFTDLFIHSDYFSDADILASATKIPSIFWALLWFIISFVLVLYLFKKELIKK